MAEIKTKPTPAGVDAFIESVESDDKREDARALDGLFRKVTGEEPRMWGPAIIGYGTYHYKYDSGREGDWMRIGFSPRKAKHSLYLIGAYEDQETGKVVGELREQLGKHSMGKNCLYIARLSDVDLNVLERMIRVSWEAMKARYPVG